ncbi:unnamed protein product [Rotaria sordida]|uniref:Uncharacterized protein n=1 Tax=Rotaria sordida TaxID=392033 RepID=A0A815JEM4_9BILA|nr:unnamed protein product [Rotaria sordida]CAF1614980.1 unnamed protein product [Rotaria sordida]
MYSSVSKLDRDIARSFLNSPSYLPIPMRNQSTGKQENFFDDILPPPHPNARLGFPTNTNIIPMYYDVIIDTVTDYDIFYPIAKQTKKYYYNSTNDQQTISDENLIYPRYQVQRLDELAVSMDFPHDYESTANWSDQKVQYEHIQPIKNYYFYPETTSHVNNEPSSVRYITTPFFWFRPVLDHNYTVCIPTSRPSLHAYITSSFDPKINSIPYSIRL